MLRSVGLIWVWVACAAGQLVTSTSAIPRTEGKPPVVFVNGYQAGCRDTSFGSTFASADQVMQRDGRVSLFFDSCSAGDNNTPIEELGNALGRFLAGLRYQDGSPVPQVDVVAHSMGGLIVRSYLAGKQTADNVFTPPVDAQVRKIVFLGTPHFGTPIATLSGDDRQSQQLLFGSPFVFALGTWNQGREDLRGVDAIAVLGNAGVRTIGTDWPAKFHDSTVSLMSGSLQFAATSTSTRILDYCHTGGIALFACDSDTRLAAIDSDAHESGRIIRSFLGGTNEWQTIGTGPAENSFLSQNAGMILQLRDKDDKVQPVNNAEAAPVKAGGSTTRLEVKNWLAYKELVPATAYNIQFNLLTGGSDVRPFNPANGAVRAAVLKPGPVVLGIGPALGMGTARALVLAPGMFIAACCVELSSQTAQSGEPYPMSLGGSQVLVNDRAIPLQYVSAGQINAVMPDDVSGVVKITVRNAAGESSVSAMVEPSAPSVHPVAVNGLTGALVSTDAPLHPGEYLTLYLTGLGAVDRREDGLLWARIQPQVRIGTSECAVTYAGRAPGFTGLDQINCHMPVDVQAGDVPVTVRSRDREAVSVAVPVR